MLPIDPTAAWTANAIFNGAGFVASVTAWSAALSSRHRALLWLVPVILVAAWLEAAFNTSVLAHTPQDAVLERRVLINLAGWSALGLIVTLAWRATPWSGRRTSPAATTPDRATASIADPELRSAMSGFLLAADHADAAALAQTYTPDFECIRVADGGGFARLTRKDLAAMSSRPVAHRVRTAGTTVHHAEILGESALVLMTRVKDLGRGLEPMFYNLVWQRRDGRWCLRREFVHQRTAPNWA